MATGHSEGTNVTTFIHSKAENGANLTIRQKKFIVFESFPQNVVVAWKMFSKTLLDKFRLLTKVINFSVWHITKENVTQNNFHRKNIR
jgi:hypothetical protein